jgi:hypothetical protein
MTEKDLLLRLEHICQVYRDINDKYWEENDLTLEEVNQCLVYISGKLQNNIFNREDPEQWQEVKYILYGRLEKKSPQTTFELSLGLPEGVGTVVLDEIEYGRMYLDENYQIGLKK